jgi:hypothetical protein
MVRIFHACQRQQDVWLLAKEQYLLFFIIGGVKYV